jgi:hypothetical protein
MAPSILGGAAWEPTPWRAVQGGVRCTASRVNEEMCGVLSCPIEPFEQFIEHCIGTGESEHLFG